MGVHACVHVCVHVSAWCRGKHVCIVYMCVHVCVWCMGVHVLSCRDLVDVRHIYCEQEISSTSKYINQWVCV